MKKYWFGIIFTVVLIAFTVYFALDTFVIQRVFEIPLDDYDYALFDVSREKTDETKGDAGETAPTGEQALTPLPATSAPAAATTPETAQTPGETPGETSGEETSGETPSETTPGETPGETTPGETTPGKETPDEKTPDLPADEPFTAEPVKTESSYTDDHIAVFLREDRYCDTDVYVADVYLRSAQYFKTALAKNRYGRNVKEETSVIAERSGAIFAVNGDFYGARERGYVLRNGQLFRTTSSGAEDLVVYPDGSFEIINEKTTNASVLKEKNAWQVFSFGPALIEDGELSVGRYDEVGQAMASNPRTAVGIVDGDVLHYVFIVSDGRTAQSKGLSLYELAVYMRSLGVRTAYNLDGGGSSTMYFDGRVINTTVSGGFNSERKVSDIVYIG